MLAWTDPTLQPISRTPYEMFLVKQRATCKTCQQPVWLLCPKFVKDADAAPTFAVCFCCRAVEQIGVGPIPKAT
jgi:hypothetical protein